MRAVAILVGVLARKWLAAMGVLLLVAVIGLGIFWVSRPPLVPKAVAVQMTTQIFYPSNLPKGIAVDPNSFTNPASNVMVFTISDGNDKIHISEQVVPPASQVDIGKFYSEQLIDATSFTTPYGQGELGVLRSGGRFASLVAGKTWIIATSGTNLQSVDLQSVLAAMQPYQSD